jgi:trans-2,3-dihydro-3-hydroxyanthranilate isomerase
MQRRYVTADVFTDTPFEGNPVAVVLDAEGLSTAQMQRIAVEFGYSESTFVLPPRDPSHTAWVRIFTPDREIPFAGHPNIGTAFVLAAQAAEAGKVLPDTLLFEEEAGLVPVHLIRDGGKVVGGELIAPEAFSRRSEADVRKVADCLSLDADDIRVDAHKPQVVSVGLPFLVVELASRDALRRCAPNPVAYKALLPLDGTMSIYAYTRDVGANDGDKAGGCDLQARMFTRRMTEDPATGSATGAAVALLTAVRRVPQLSLRVRQGVDMGRASLLLTACDMSSGTAVVRVGGRCVAAMSGTFELAGVRP